MKDFARGCTGILLAVFLFLQFQTLFLPKNHSLLTMDDFYALEKNSIDVLFIGSSHVVNGIKSQVIENITGMKTMSCAIIGQYLPFHVAYLKEALKYQHPKFLIIDMYRFRDREYGYVPADIHESVNGLHFWGG